ncbi:hypothetical protein HELRODRAFT_163155 [Helobdella robusta]|uniref:EF-hand domain-containing protein n=1 Tax=Helobdella robusta TaxID=6412 RepID=T1ETQ7_HELRO|nr:hypothetical protein HELRODRAFT_163155 [Helobdella robusta]ESN96125.1 hypothetical protein HELRODRAFT_163155 [Helobdella robusta]
MNLIKFAVLSVTLALILNYILNKASFYKFFNKCGYIVGCENEKTTVVSMDGGMIFHKFDEDGDGVLSANEFTKLMRRWTQNGQKLWSYNLPAGIFDRNITLRASYKPLLFNTLLNNENNIISKKSEFSGLQSWKEVNEKSKTFPIKHFKLFLPDVNSDSSIENLIGKTYWLVKTYTKYKNGPGLPSNRYYPPHLSEPTEQFLYEILRMFHERPFVHMRFEPGGSLAVVRAYDDQYLDIHFRIHAEFQLNVPPNLPFWFTPAMFLGNVIIDRTGNDIKQFKLFVPNKKRLNVDLEWMRKMDENDDGEENEVNIGYMPHMKIEMQQPTTDYDDDDDDAADADDDSGGDEDVSGVKWRKDISILEAKKLLEIGFFPFKKVNC